MIHNLYRPWCRHCVEGRAQEFPHYKRKSSGPSRVPLVAFYYAGVIDKGDFVTSLHLEWSDEGVVRILVSSIRTPDDLHSCVLGHVVLQQGIDLNQYAVDCLVDDVFWTGCTRVLLKSDNEAAVLELLVEALRESRVNGLQQVMSENSPEYDPQSNGAAESVVTVWKGMFRTQRSALEERIGARIPAKLPLSAWVAKWAGGILVIAYQRVRGKPFTTRLQALGEMVRYKLRPKEPLEHSSDGKRFL